MMAWNWATPFKVARKPCHEAVIAGVDQGRVLALAAIVGLEGERPVLHHAGHVL
jgi:hypothetical protein